MNYPYYNFQQDLPNFFAGADTNQQPVDMLASTLRPVAQNPISLNLRQVNYDNNSLNCFKSTRPSEVAQVLVCDVSKKTSNSNAVSPSFNTMPDENKLAVNFTSMVDD